MKTTVILFTFFITFSVSTLHAQWYQQNSSTNFKLNSVYFVDNDNGWAVGDDGIILHTNNSGETWNQQNSPEDYNLESVYFLDINHGWVAGGYHWDGWDGYGGIVLRTANGGANWDLVFIQEEHYVYDVTFTDSLVGWASGINGYYSWGGGSKPLIMKSTNGGLTWEYQDISLIIQSIYSVQFIDSLYGWAVGGYVNGSTGYPYGQIYSTLNGGTTWNLQLDSVGMGPLYSASFTDMQHGWTVGGAMGSLQAFTILHTSNGGNVWSQQNCNVNCVFESVCFIDSLRGWVVGGNWIMVPDTGRILNTIDGGITWELQSLKPGIILYDVFFTDANYGWIVGDSGTILHTENGGFVDVNEPLEAIVSKISVIIYPNPASTELYISVENQNINQVTFYTITGQQVLQERPANGAIDISDLQAGMYIVEVTIENSKLRQKLLIQR